MFISGIEKMEILQELVLPFFISVVASCLTALIAFKKYKTEKHWDDKRQKYFLVVEAVEYVAVWYSNNRDSLHGEPILVRFDDDTKELEHSKRIIQKFSSIGQLYFSKEFSSELTDLYLTMNKILNDTSVESELSDNDLEKEYWIQSRYYLNIYNVAFNSLEKLLKISEKDLHNR